MVKRVKRFIVSAVFMISDIFDLLFVDWDLVGDMVKCVTIFLLFPFLVCFSSLDFVFNSKASKTDILISFDSSTKVSSKPKPEESAWQMVETTLCGTKTG